MPAATPSRAPVALVTGGAIRVGAALVRALAEAGYRVWLHAHRSAAQAENLRAELGSAVIDVVLADLSDSRDRQRLCAHVSRPDHAYDGCIDVLVNSAASFEHGSFGERSDDDLRRVLETNLVAPISLVRGLLPAMLRAAQMPCAHRSGPCVVNLVDLGALAPWPHYLDHCTAKAGLVMATKALALEVSPDIRVNAIAPGTVLWPPSLEYQTGSPWREEITRAIPLGDIGSPQDVAQALLYLVGAPYVTGQVLTVDGGRSVAQGR